MAPAVMPPTFTGGAGLHGGLGSSNKHSNNTTMPTAEAYMERQPSQAAYGPIAAKRRSQSIIKMDRSGEPCCLLSIRLDSSCNNTSRVHARVERSVTVSLQGYSMLVMLL